MPNWLELSRSRQLGIPEEAVAAIAPALDSLERDFRPLLHRLDPSVEPAINLSEQSVLGE